MQVSIIRSNSSIFKVLGHNKRLEIVTLLQGHELTVGQITQMTDMRQAAVSQHLIMLKDQKLVCTQKLGKEIYYTLCPEIFAELALFVKGLARLSPIEDAEPTVIDPVCGMALTPSSASYTCTYDGVRHYFCGKGCLKQFGGNA